MAIGDLTVRQEQFLSVVGKSLDITRQFYFTGGTCLAAYYLHHRVSEDLDFFSEEEVQAESIWVWLQGKKGDLGFSSVDYQQSFNRNLYFLRFGDRETLKTEFTFYPFGRIESGEMRQGLPVDSLRDIAVNKLFTTYQKPRGRDYFDLYHILMDTAWTLPELIKLARVKFDTHIDSLQLASQFMAVTDTLDDPILSEGKYNPRIIEDFFLRQAEAFRSQVLG